VLDRLQDTLREIDSTKARLNQLAKEKTEIVAKIALTAAQRAKVLDSDLSDAEVTKRLKEMNLIK
jgi:YbbR domain-containing protein